MLLHMKLKNLINCCMLQEVGTAARSGHSCKKWAQLQEVGTAARNGHSCKKWIQQVVIRPAALGTHPALPDVYGEVDELAVLDNKVLQSLRLQELFCVFFHEEATAGGGEMGGKGEGRWEGRGRAAGDEVRGVV